MNRFTHVFLAVFYLALSCGFSVNVHYCGGKVASVKVISSDGLCCCGPEGMMEKCCSNESIFLKLETEQKVSNTFKVEIREVASCNDIPAFNESKLDSPSVTACQNAPDPPPIPGRSLRIQQCSLISFG